MTGNIIMHFHLLSNQSMFSSCTMLLQVFIHRGSCQAPSSLIPMVGCRNGMKIYLASTWSVYLREVYNHIPKCYYSIILGHRMIKPKIVQNAIEGWYLFLSVGGIRCHTSLFWYMIMQPKFDIKRMFNVPTL